MRNYEFDRIKRIVDEAENVVFFGGAGVSTESGIPDFRGSGGLYTGAEGDVSPEEILHVKYFIEHPEKFYEYYKANMLYPNALPNPAHYALARLEEQGKLSGVITQNIDGLHQAAGSKNVIELHGTVDRNICLHCGKVFSQQYVQKSNGVPRCDECGHMIRPDIVLYGEALDSDPFYAAQELIYYADVLIVGGTSLRVAPASTLVQDFEGEHLIIVNYDPTPYDALAEYVLNDSIADVLDYIVNN